MSDFDREAERERLREQFEADKQKREQSERMSELLLKGATMTNKHCDRCGDPIFRWDGQEFCPTCQGGPAGEPTDAEGGADSHGDAGADAADSQPTQADGTPSASDADPATRPDEEPAPRADAAELASAPTPSEARRQSGASDATPRPSSTPEPAPRPDHPTEPSGPATGRQDVAAARASLARTLASLSARAESADDLSTTREYLAAAKEAAEALDAAERAGR